jgi:predicted Zn-dependent protease
MVQEGEMRSRRIWLVSLFVLGAIGAAGYGRARMLEARRYRTGIEQAKQELGAGRLGAAKRHLDELLPSRLGDGEVEYLLGIYEVKRGRMAAAAEALERVPRSSSFGSRAAVQWALALMAIGRFARAEEILESARIRAKGTDAMRVLHALGVLYELEGRADDYRKSLVDLWPYAESPGSLIRKLAQLNTAPLQLLTLRQALETNPSDDDRVWLGRASLAVRTGQLGLAAKLLDACQKRRPDDPAVWRARLELALAAGDLDQVWKALERLPADGLSETRIARTRAGLAALANDASAERAALTAVIEREPGDTIALDRLAALAARAGDNQERARLRAKRADATALLERYLSLTKDASPDSDPAELARMAVALGRTIEANAWALIRDGKAGPPGPTREPLVPERPGFNPSRGAGAASGRSFADLCADLRKVPPRRQAAGSPGVVPQYVDLALTAGLRFVQDNAVSPQKRPPETASGGVGLIDFDNDGWLDVYCVQGGHLPPASNQTCDDRLFRNRRDGTFEDVSDRAGISRLPGGYGHGVAVGDYDNDGHPDLFVTRWRSYALLHNRGDGTFDDATARAGLSGGRDWPTSAAWADLDGDGDLDLYVCHYLVCDLNTPMICENALAHANQYCSPLDFVALPDHVFRNDGGRFVDVTKESGFVDPDGRGLGVVAADLDDDNRIDLYVANDMSANYLFHNLGEFRFEESALHSGASANSSGGFQAGMGVACGDLDGDGRLDLAVTNYYGESTTFFRNLGRGLFCDDTTTIGLAAPTRCLLGFGVAFLDANNDGWLDLISANGHVNDHRPSIPWKMPTKLLVGSPGGRLNEPSPGAGEPFQPLHLGRGLAVGDLDNDGQVDVIVQSQNETVAYLHNQTKGGGHWVTLKLEGVRSNRDGVGARVVLLAGGERRVDQRKGGGSYQSASDPRLHFGLGASDRIDRLEVRWPSGFVESYTGLAADRGYLLREGAGTAKPLEVSEK